MTTLIPQFDLKNGGATPTGAVNRPINEKLAEWVSVLDFGAVGDGTTDDTAAIQAAITASVGKSLYFPSGVYVFSSTLTFQNNTIYYGDGKSTYYTGATTSTGTVLKYTGTSNAIKVSNPINSSTAANIVVQDLLIYCSTLTTYQAAFWDTGSTFLTFDRVGFKGNYFGLILDQSELVVVNNCEFNLPNANAVGLWLVNGPDQTIGALTGYTNRIDVQNCQFNSSSTSGVLIADDGGTSHNFINNNFNGAQTAIRVNATVGLTISGSEFELYSAYAITTATTKLLGGAGSASGTITINENVILTSSSNTLSPLTFITSSVGTLAFNNNVISTPSTVSPVANATSGVGVWVGSGNIQTGAGLTSPVSLGNNYNISASFFPTWTAAGTAPAIGNGVLNSNYVRNGNQVTVILYLELGSTTTTGTGAWTFTLPFSSSATYAATGSVQMFVAGNYYIGSCFVGGASNQLQIASNASATLVQSTVPATWTTGNYARVTITYPYTASL